MSVKLNKCTDESCDPQVQIRGKMGPHDYISHSPKEDPATYYEQVETHPDIDTDVRICCKSCGTTTGWQKADAPGMAGAGLDYLIKTWNEEHGKS